VVSAREVPRNAVQTTFIDLPGGRIEYSWCGEGSGAPVIMLHEGLGSLAMWKDFPQRLAAVTGRRVLAYSRFGYGWSDPIRERRRPDFMHREALDVLPELLQRLGVTRPILFGHSDGGSIALIHAAAAPVAGVVAIAPHVFVEAFSLAEIRLARRAFEEGDLGARLARYHRDPGAAFLGWNDIWLDPVFEAWTIEDLLPQIGCPVLAVQGEDDEYGTMEQIERIGRMCPGASLLKLPACGHSPHRQQPEALLEGARAFVTGIRSS